MDDGIKEFVVKVVECFSIIDAFEIVEEEMCFMLCCLAKDPFANYK